MRSYIKEIGVYLPGEPVDNETFARKYSGGFLHADMIRVLFGGQERFLADKDVHTSDMAVMAANSFLKEEDKSKIDLLIFASASADLIEPSTANIVQSKLGLSCPVFDLKNACNSVVSALQVADAFIKNNIHKNILIVSGEKPSDTIRFHPSSKQDIKNNIAAISFGDGGCALWIAGTKEDRGLRFSRFLSMGEFWHLSTIRGGGSMHPFDLEMNYFQGETAKLIDVLQDSNAQAFANKCIKDGPWGKAEIDLLITHQVATHFYKSLAETLDFPLEKIHQTFHKYGNTASTAIPIALHDAIQNGKAKRGDKIMLVGVAAGVSVGILFLTL